jgi:hypothetical protein
MEELLDGLVGALLQRIVGMCPDGGEIRCLSCGATTAYGAPACAACGAVYGERPPFAHPNHVSQIVDATEGFREGRLSRRHLVERVGRWRAMVDEVDAEWQFSTPLCGRFGDEEVAEALAVLDQGVALLFASLARLQAVCNPSDRPPSPPERGLLERVEADLVEFFRASCSGCATLIDAREQLALDTPEPPPSLGGLIDIQTG